MRPRAYKYRRRELATETDSLHSRPSARWIRTLAQKRGMTAVSESILDYIRLNIPLQSDHFRESDVRVTFCPTLFPPLSSVNPACIRETTQICFCTPHIIHLPSFEIAAVAWITYPSCIKKKFMTPRIIYLLIILLNHFSDYESRYQRGWKIMRRHVLYLCGYICGLNHNARLGEALHSHHSSLDLRWSTPLSSSSGASGARKSERRLTRTENLEGETSRLLPPSVLLLC